MNVQKYYFSQIYILRQILDPTIYLLFKYLEMLVHQILLVLNIPYC